MLAVHTVEETINAIANTTSITSMDFFLSGDANFRRTLYPEYKGNRRKMERPALLEPLKEWYSANYPVFKKETLEADDLLGLNQTDKTAIVSIDKDMLMIPGWHYNYVKDEYYFIDSFTGIYNFYYQILIGDPADNIKGAPGIGKVKATKILEGCTTEEEMLEAVVPYFSCWEEFDMTASILWIQQKDRVTWDATGISESKRQSLTEISEGSDS